MIKDNALYSKLQTMLIRLTFSFRRIKQHGLLGITKRVLKRIIILILAILLLPVSLVLYFLGYCRPIIFIDRIGHLAIESDCLLKAQRLGLISDKKWLLLAPKQRVANQHFLNYWKSSFIIFQSRISCFFLEALTLWPFLRYDASHFTNNNEGAQYGYEVCSKWGNRKPNLTLTQEDEIFGAEQLQRLGIPKDAWFVCVHSREGGFSPVDEALHAHRNGKIENLFPAINEITQRGGWVIRLGDPTMKSMPPMFNVIDYAHHPLRSSRFDIILCAKAKFILGNTSGICFVGMAFGTPCVLLNMIPMPTLGFLPTDISIPKLYRRQLDQQYLSFAEVMNSELSTYRYSSLYEKSNIIIEENSPEDILAVTIEMLNRLNDKHIETEQDKNLHAMFISLFTPKHYSFGACSKVSSTFLNKYRNLLIEEIKQ